MNIIYLNEQPPIVTEKLLEIFGQAWIPANSKKEDVERWLSFTKDLTI